MNLIATNNQNNQFLKVFIILYVFFFTSTAYAQFSEPTVDQWSLLVATFKEHATLSHFAVMVALVQGLFYVTRTALGDLLGAHKLYILSILSILVTIGSKLVSGEPWTSAFTDAASLMAYQQAAHQWFAQHRKWNDDQMELDHVNPDDSWRND